MVRENTWWTGPPGFGMGGDDEQYVSVRSMIDFYASNCKSGI
jgi:hypothetical protein